MTSFRAFSEFTLLRAAIFASENLFSSRTLYKLFPFYFFFGQWKWLCYFLSECNRTSESHFANIFFDAEWCFINVAGKLHLPRWSYRENNSCGGVFLNLFFFLPRFQRPQKTVFGFNTSWVNFEHHHQFSGLSVNVHDLFDKHYIRYHETFATYV